MRKILFVCHGNICRSAMAEAMCREMLRERGISDVVVDSAATSREEIGNRMYPPAQAKLREKGVPIGEHRARQLTRADYDDCDWLIGMDAANMRNMARICGGDPAGKMHRLLDYTDRPGDVADPWYTGDFEATWRDVSEGCKCLLAEIEKSGI